MRTSPTTLEIRAAQDRAEDATDKLQALRKVYRRRSSPGGVRQPVIELALRETKPAARALRRLIGMTPHHPVLAPFDAENREILRVLGRERTQLRKMLR